MMMPPPNDKAGTPRRTTRRDRDLAAVLAQLPTAECVPWPAGRAQDGYGKSAAHRFVYEAAVGPIPAGLVLDHTCHNGDSACIGGHACAHRSCVNPAHLDAVTNRVNMQRATLRRYGRVRVGLGWPVSDGRCR